MTNEQTALVLIQLRDELLVTLDNIKERCPELQGMEKCDPFSGMKYYSWPTLEPLYELAGGLSDKAFLLTGTRIP